MFSKDQSRSAPTKNSDTPAVISSAAEHRNLLLQTLVGVLENKVSVPQANAVVGLSAEVHKSIRQEFEMRCYASENVTLRVERKDD